MAADPAAVDENNTGDPGLDGLENAGQLADELKPQALKPAAATAIADVIDELAAGDTTTYVNTDGSGITRVAVITDRETVRVLMLTTSWKWRGPYTPDDPEGYLNDRGYVPAHEEVGDA
jgi:hypothetical protein